MTFNPLRVLDHVLDEYEQHLLTEFRAKDPALRTALEREMDAPRFLSQDTWFSAHRPFAAGKPWRDLLGGAKGGDALAEVMIGRSARFGARNPELSFRHQSLAIEHLRGLDAGPLVVTTGTGSGKTEAFLLPVILRAIEDWEAHKNATALTAVLVYPMNALANDQEERIREYLDPKQAIRGQPTTVHAGSERSRIVSK